MSVTAPAPVAPDPTIDFVGLFADQTEDTILARMRDWANEGLDPVADADQWVDTREGGHWWMATMPMVRELARLYDLAGTEVPMSAFILWAWGSYLDDLGAAYNVDRKAATQSQGFESFTGPAGTAISLSTTVATVPVGPDDPTPTFSTTASGVIPDAGAGTGTLTLAITADQVGKAGDVAAHAITVPSTPLPDGVTIDNAAPTGGGTDVETDEAFRARVLQALVGQGGANVNAYLRWATQFAGVGAAKVVPAASGPNSVLVMITDADGQPLPSTTVAGLQTDLDPVPGKGSGLAPVGAQVTVDTSTLLTANVSADVTWAAGYSSDGTGGTIAQHDPIAAAIEAYYKTIQPGGTVVLSHVTGIIATFEGVADVASVQINGAAASLPVGLSPPQVPVLLTLTLT